MTDKDGTIKVNGVPNDNVWWNSVNDFLDFLDGWGVVYEDMDLVEERLRDYAGVSPDSKLTIDK